MNVVVFVYGLGGMVTFWVALILAASFGELDCPSPNVTAAVSLIAGVLWPFVVIAAVEMWAAAFLIETAGVRFTTR